MELAETCEPKDEQTINKILAEFKPKTEVGEEMWEVMRTEMSIEKVVAVEVDHCP